jgi:hypothetical protein
MSVIPMREGLHNFSLYNKKGKSAIYRVVPINATMVPKFGLPTRTVSLKNSPRRTKVLRNIEDRAWMEHTDSWH